LLRRNWCGCRVAGPAGCGRSPRNSATGWHFGVPQFPERVSANAPASWTAVALYRFVALTPGLPRPTGSDGVRHPLPTSLVPEGLLIIARRFQPRVLAPKNQSSPEGTAGPPPCSPVLKFEILKSEIPPRVPGPSTFPPVNRLFAFFVYFAVLLSRQSTTNSFDQPYSSLPSAAKAQLSTPFPPPQRGALHIAQGRIATTRVAIPPWVPRTKPSRTLKAVPSSFCYCRSRAFCRRHRPEDVLKVDADEDGVGGDDAADALRYLINTKPRTVTQRKLHGL
jgi:hypothetical protein